MTKNLSEIIKKICDGHNLTSTQSAEAFSIIMSGEASPVQIASFLIALKFKGETIDEIVGAVKVLRSKAEKIKAQGVVIDTCGTGGDQSGTLNISTIVAIILSACGVKVAKHGNKAISSKSGSADVLSQLGLNLDVEKEVVQDCLDQLDICFMMAPKFHTAMKYVAPIRTQLGCRTIFNILGPLINPAQVEYQLLGVYDKNLVMPIAQVLQKIGLKQAWVVHGYDGVDELSITGPSYVCQLKDGNITEFEVNPSDAGLPTYSLDQIQGKDASYNAKEAEKLLQGAGDDAYRAVVLLNAAAGLIIANKASNLKEAVAMAAIVLDSGKAADKLVQLVNKTN